MLVRDGDGRTPTLGGRPLSVASFRQMCGRAGRLGYDKQGEAILMCTGTAAAGGGEGGVMAAQRLMTADMEPLRSGLPAAYGGGLEKLLLELVSCGRLVKEDQVLPFVDCTLMRVQAQDYQEVSQEWGDAIGVAAKTQLNHWHNLHLDKLLWICLN